MSINNLLPGFFQKRLLDTALQLCKLKYMMNDQQSLQTQYETTERELKRLGRLLKEEGSFEQPASFGFYITGQGVVFPISSSTDPAKHRAHYSTHPTLRDAEFAAKRQQAFNKAVYLRDRFGGRSYAQGTKCWIPRKAYDGWSIEYNSGPVLFAFDSMDTGARWIEAMGQESLDTLWS